MPPLGDQDELERYKAVLVEAVRFGNLVQWKLRASAWVARDLSNHTQKSIVELMYECRGEVRQKSETRSEYRDRYPFHYDFVIPIGRLSVFIETVFEPGATDEDSKIRIVSIHESSTSIK